MKLEKVGELYVAGKGIEVASTELTAAEQKLDTLADAYKRIEQRDDGQIEGTEGVSPTKRFDALAGKIRELCGANIIRSRSSELFRLPDCAIAVPTAEGVRTHYLHMEYEDEYTLRHFRRRRTDQTLYAQWVPLASKDGEDRTVTESLRRSWLVRPVSAAILELDLIRLNDLNWTLKSYLAARAFNSAP